jgi:hypothetical protein
MGKDRYVLEGVLKEGRLGAVYRARDTSADASSPSVSVWVVPRELTNDPAALPALKRDIARARDLTHENIARVFDLGWDGDRYFVTGELLEDAETLQNVLEALSPERLERDEVDAIVGAIGAALAHAHAKGVVHGDVRAENVLVSDGHVKLANFVPTSLARKTSGVAEPTDDIRALANLADELYFDGIKVTPQPRAKATEPPPRNRNRGTPPRPLEILDEAGGGILWHRRAPIRPQTARRPIGFLTACLVVLAALGVLAMAFRGQDAAPLLDAPQIQEIRDWMAQGPGGSSPELAARTEVVRKIS